MDQIQARPEAEAEDPEVKRDRELREGAIQNLADGLKITGEEALKLLQEAEPGF
ncbi:hypothetical protein [Bradyrhizobium sp. RDI18]|uniref:hypothetical protein n=1 Tax=Bradyrhizobium sp. RDI18 TaxID=3367400 RepID=UPI00370F8F07